MWWISILAGMGLQWQSQKSTAQNDLGDTKKMLQK
jgi:hypothetical protein